MLSTRLFLRQAKKDAPNKSERILMRDRWRGRGAAIGGFIALAGAIAIGVFFPPAIISAIGVLAWTGLSLTGIAGLFTLEAGFGYANIQSDELNRRALEVEARSVRSSHASLSSAFPKESKVEGEQPDAAPQPAAPVISRQSSLFQRFLNLFSSSASEDKRSASPKDKPRSPQR